MTDIIVNDSDEPKTESEHEEINRENESEGEEEWEERKVLTEMAGVLGRTSDLLLAMNSRIENLEARIPEQLGTMLESQQTCIADQNRAILDTLKNTLTPPPPPEPIVETVEEIPAINPENVVEENPEAKTSEVLPRRKRRLI